MCVCVCVCVCVCARAGLLRYTCLSVFVWIVLCDCMAKSMHFENLCQCFKKII